MLEQDVTTAEVQQLVEAVDVDGNAELDFEEFVYAVCGDHDTSTRRKIRNAFDMFDVDRSGGISRTELENVGSKLGMTFAGDELDRLFLESDADGDGQIDITEFSNLLLESIAVAA